MIDRVVLLVVVVVLKAACRLSCTACVIFFCFLVMLRATEERGSPCGMLRMHAASLVRRRREIGREMRWIHTDVRTYMAKEAR